MQSQNTTEVWREILDEPLRQVQGYRHSYREVFHEWSELDHSSNCLFPLSCSFERKRLDRQASLSVDMVVDRTECYEISYQMIRILRIYRYQLYFTSGAPDNWATGEYLLRI